MDESKQTTLQDLNDDCLRAVFKLLNYEGIVNIALSCRKDDRVNVPLSEVFKKKIGKLSVSTDYGESDISRNIQLIERFGTHIKRLDFSFQVTEVHDLCKAVMENCKDNITDLRLEYSSDILNQHPVCPKRDCTQDVKTASRFLSNLALQFPKVQRLSLSLRENAYSQEIDRWHTTAFPTMTHFKIVGNELDWMCTDVGRRKYKMLKSFLSKNQQLQSLKIQLDETPKDFFDFLDKNLPNLKSLKVKSADFSGLDRKENNVKTNNTLKNLKTLKLKVNDLKHIIDFRFLGGSLEYLKLQQKTDFTASHLVNLVSYFSALQKLKLVVPSIEYYGDGYDIYDRTISMEGLANLPERLKHLTKFVLKFEEKNEIEIYIETLPVLTNFVVDIDKTQGKIRFIKN